jgi:hypothetical protein
MDTDGMMWEGDCAKKAKMAKGDKRYFFCAWEGRMEMRRGGIADWHVTVNLELEFWRSGEGV